MAILLLRLVIFIVVGFALGAVITPVMWAPVLLKSSAHIIGPFMILSSAIFVGAVGYAWAQFTNNNHD